MVFKTHLDIGFTALASDVRRAYADEFVPGAIKLARELAKAGGAERFVWTTGSWLIADQLAHAAPSARENLDRAIREGHVAWHALPFTTHTEMMDADLFRHGLSIARRLDEAYGRRTIAAKMTDVPGHSLGVVPLLAEAGVRYLHIGTNPGSATPQVPPGFVWRAADGSEIVVNYTSRYGSEAGQALVLPGLDQALYISLTGDNRGPPSRASIERIWSELAANYPNAEIRAGRLDDFAAAAWEHRAELPVVTSEIGDSWIHGIASDPTLVRNFRALMRIRGMLVDDATGIDAFSTGLLMVPEHTWGMDLKRFLPDYVSYPKIEFAAARARDVVPADINPESLAPQVAVAEPQPGGWSFRAYEESWQEKRGYLDAAIGTLSAENQVTARHCLEELRPTRINPTGAERHAGPATGRQHLGRFEVEFGADGSIISLVDDDSHVWADHDHPLAAFSYVTFSAADYETWFKQYNENLAENAWWVAADFGKPGMELLRPGAEHRTWVPSTHEVSSFSADEADRVVISARMPDAAALEHGAPRELQLSYRFQRERPEIELALSWFGKDAYRLPEASWLSFAPRVLDASLWRIDKLGTLVDPHDVVVNGGRNLHAAGVGLHYRGPDSSVELASLDAPLVAPGGPRLLTFDNVYGDVQRGFAFNLHNNVWGTNFRMWFEDDALFRFRLTLTGA